MLVDHIRPQAGRLRVFGLDPTADGVEVRRRTAYLPGDLALYDRLTVRQHLRWLARLAGGVEPDAIDELAERLSLDLTRPVRQLSKGNRQKVGLVQAFMLGSDLLVLDEPTAGLDPLMQHEFMQMAREQAAAGRTVFLSSHDLSEVQEIADRVGIIRDGKLVAVESVDQLRARAVRHVEVTFAGTPDLDALRELEGLANLAVTGSTATFRFDGDMDPLLGVLAREHVIDLTSANADLDEVFLTFYETGNGDEG
jgi:ABC-2 type transport system ATP-binding protein